MFIIWDNLYTIAQLYCHCYLKERLCVSKSPTCALVYHCKESVPATPLLLNRLVRSGQTFIIMPRIYRLGDVRTGHKLCGCNAGVTSYFKPTSKNLGTALHLCYSRFIKYTLICLCIFARMTAGKYLYICMRKPAL